MPSNINGAVTDVILLKKHDKYLLKFQREIYQHTIFIPLKELKNK
jgi:hypothetical protein